MELSGAPSVPYPASTTLSAASSTAAPPPAGGEGRRVCIVEDDEAVRGLFVSILDGRGYRLLVAGDAEQALRRCRGAGGADLLVSDVQLPGIGGLELFRRLRAEFPGDVPSYREPSTTRCFWPSSGPTRSSRSRSTRTPSASASTLCSVAVRSRLPAGASPARKRPREPRSDDARGPRRGAAPGRRHPAQPATVRNQAGVAAAEGEPP